jgi:hypothetical protein
VFGDQLQGNFLAAASDHDREFLLFGKRGQLTQALFQNGQIVSQVFQAGNGRAKFKIVFFVVSFEPARADAEHGASIADMIEGARHIGDQLNIAVAVATDQVPKGSVLAVTGHSGQSGPGFKVRAFVGRSRDGGVGHGGSFFAVERIKVVPEPQAVYLESVTSFGCFQ